MINQNYIVVPIRRYWVLIIFSGILCASLGYKTLMRFSNLFSFDFEYLALTICGVVASILICNVFLWLLLGQEEISFRENEMIYTRTNSLIRISKKIPIENILIFRRVKLEYPGGNFIDARRQEIVDKRNAILFWSNMGRIEMVIEGKESKSILNGISNGQIEEVLLIMNNQLKGKIA